MVIIPVVLIFFGTIATTGYYFKVLYQKQLLLMQKVIMKYRWIFLAIFFVIAYSSYGQTIPLNDTTITFKNEEGKVLSREEVRELMKETFSIKQDNINGKKTITIIPSATNERALLYAKLDTFKSNLINKPIAVFKFTDFDNKTWKSKELKGKIVLINFWFTACEPCITEMPLLNELVAANKDKSVVFLAPAPENETQIKKFLKKFKFDYTIIPSSNDYIDASGIEYFPTHIVIDKEGIIRQVIISYSEDIKEKLQQEINKLLN
jgi:thiol-disulfide isomerase/thioredoxin